ncbi:MAG: enoyl-CoA hydratase-related protein [Anaerovoracaceae bacterium]|nr:enoyl-CoA hydratase-related protein [Anaerovoracaceae bacterium]
MEYKEYKNILFEVKEGIGYVTMNRPKAMNALNTEVVAELDDLFTDIEADDEVKAVIVTGAGRAFVGGADIAYMGALDGLKGREFVMQGQAMMDRVENLSKPVIAAINGFALGGGNELAMACDIRIASEAAKFGQPEVNLGIIPGYGGTQRLPRLVGKGVAKKLVLTAEIIDAQEALKIGLVDEVVAAEELMEKAEAMAKTIMAKAPIAVKMAIAAINNGMNTDLRTGIQFEAEAFQTSFNSEDRVEGMAAFLEKRTAEFKNR